MTLVFSTQINTEQELIILTEKILHLISRNSIVLLSGGLSAGKTTLVSHFCKLFGIQIIQSPTYAIHHRYSNNKITIDHFDLYRLETEEDVQSSGFYDLLNLPADYKFIEWPDKVGLQDFPKGISLYKISITVVGVDLRQIDIYKIN